MKAHKKMQYKIFAILALVGIISTCLAAEIFINQPQREIDRQMKLVKFLSQAHFDALEYIKSKSVKDKTGVDFALKFWGQDIYEAKKLLGNDSQEVKNKFERLYQSYCYETEKKKLQEGYKEIFARLHSLSNMLFMMQYDKGQAELDRFSDMLKKAKEKATNAASIATLKYWIARVPDLERSFEIRKRFNLIDRLGYEIYGLIEKSAAKEAVDKINAIQYVLEGIMRELPYYEYGNYLMARDIYLEYQELKKDIQETNDDVKDKKYMA